MVAKIQDQWIYKWSIDHFDVELRPRQLHRTFQPHKPFWIKSPFSVSNSLLFLASNFPFSLLSYRWPLPRNGNCILDQEQRLSEESSFRWMGLSWSSKRFRIPVPFAINSRVSSTLFWRPLSYEGHLFLGATFSGRFTHDQGCVITSAVTETHI